MILALQEYVKQHPQVTLAELGLHFQTPVAIIAKMVQRLESKGLVTRAPTAPCQQCEQSCGQCPLKNSETGS